MQRSWILYYDLWSLPAMRQPKNWMAHERQPLEMQEMQLRIFQRWRDIGLCLNLNAHTAAACEFTTGPQKKPCSALIVKKYGKPGAERRLIAPKRGAKHKQRDKNHGTGYRGSQWDWGAGIRACGVRGGAGYNPTDRDWGAGQESEIMQSQSRCYLQQREMHC